ncbi:hypothetical protein HGRIS_011589 [Hohenbuehelia grisea]|uniref:Uncharacterized protein n=1 Tax=Hohenbuehelia grisea TaxID=104357 RepID=A0ABR3JVL9_9AGAR
MNRAKQDSTHRHRLDRERDLQNTPKAALLSLLQKEERTSKQTRKLLHAALTQLDSSSRKLAATEAGARKSDDVQLATGIKALQTVYQAQEVATNAQSELNAYKMQLEYAQREMQRAQDAARLAEKMRMQAEQEAIDARAAARRLKEEALVREALEEGRRQGMAEGFREATAAANLRDSRMIEQARRRSQPQRRIEGARPVAKSATPPRPPSTVPSIPQQPAAPSPIRERSVSLSHRPPSRASTASSRHRHHSRASTHGTDTGSYHDALQNPTNAYAYEQQRPPSRSYDAVPPFIPSLSSTHTPSPHRSAHRDSIVSIPQAEQAPPPEPIPEPAPTPPAPPQGIPYLRMPTPPSPRSRSISSTSSSQRHAPIQPIFASDPQPQIPVGIPRTSGSGSGSRARARTISDPPLPGRRSPDAPTPSSTATGFSQLDLITFPNPVTDFSARRERERERFALSAIPEHLTGSSRASASPQVQVQAQVPTYQYDDDESSWPSVTSSPTTVPTPSSMAFSDPGDPPAAVGMPPPPNWPVNLNTTPEIVVTAALENDTPRPIPPPLSLQQDNFLAPYRPGLRSTRSGDSMDSRRLSTESSGSVQILIEPPSRPSSAGHTQPNTAVGYLSPNHAPSVLPPEQPSQPRIQPAPQPTHHQQQWYTNPNPPAPVHAPVIPPPGAMHTESDFPPGFVPHATPSAAPGMRLATPSPAPGGRSREAYALAPTPPGIAYPVPLGGAAAGGGEYADSESDSTSVTSSGSGSSTATEDHTPVSRSRRELLRANTRANSATVTDIYALPPGSVVGTPAAGAGMGIGGPPGRPGVTFSPRANVFIT